MTSDETSAELDQQSRRVPSAFAAVDNLAIEKSDLLLASSARVCNDSNETTDDLSDCSVCLVTDRQQCSDVLATTAASSNVGSDPAASVNCVETVMQTTANDSPISDSDTSFGSSVEEMPNTTNTGWSMSTDLPALSFFCNICGDVVDCELDAKKLIFDHYAGHGISNIELMDETTPSGEKVIKLIELPVVQANTSKTTHSQATHVSTTRDQMTSSNSTMTEPQCSSQTGGGNSSTAHTQKKQRRVTWADEVFNTVTQQPLQLSSPVCPDAAHRDASVGLSKQWLTSCPSQQTRSGSVTSALCGNNNVTMTTAVAPGVFGDSWSPSTALPVDDSISRAIRCPKAAAERARMFWSKSSLGEATSVGGPSLPTPVSTALRLQSKHAAELSTSAFSEAWRDGTDVVICID